MREGQIVWHRPGADVAMVHLESHSIWRTLLCRQDDTIDPTHCHYIPLFWIYLPDEGAFAGGSAHLARRREELMRIGTVVLHIHPRRRDSPMITFGRVCGINDREGTNTILCSDGIVEEAPHALTRVWGDSVVARELVEAYSEKLDR